ncbi:MAG: hypothetical protein ACTSPI_00370 [Candidatus Heimdallarchaeaceae archaeon]
MALIVGQNSWATILEADTYLTDRINAEDWFELSESGASGEVSKSSLLISAYYWLLNAPQLELSSSLTDDNVKNAQIESAFFLLEHYNALNQRRAAMFTGVEEFKLSQKREKLNINKLQIPNYIIGALKTYIGENVIAELKGYYDNES